MSHTSLFTSLSLILVSILHAQPPLRPLPPEKVLSVLDLSRPGLEKVRASAEAGDRQEALRRLLAYFRARTGVKYSPVLRVGGDATASTTIADELLRHVFDMGSSYPPQDYGTPVAWDSDSLHDIEWVAGVQRFHWQDVLLRAWLATGDEKYVKGWMDLTADWIRTHPVEPQQLAWLDIQVGLRSNNLCAAFVQFVRSPSITPSFLGVLLASFYDHAQKMALYPRLAHHNKTVIEADGLARIAILFPEFRDSEAWLTRAFAILADTVPRQVTPEGVQREWTPSYHMGVSEILERLIRLARHNHREVPGMVTALTEKMFDYVLAMTPPDRSLPMFGDTRRRPQQTEGASTLLEGTRLFPKPEYFAVARGEAAGWPKTLSYGFPISGMYFLRSGWDHDAIYMALHCSPLGPGGHDQPDNGTFELYAFGRWLMPDSGSYAYANTPHADERDWFRLTAVHDTLTLDGRNSVNAPRHLLWKSAPGHDVVVFENASYPELKHRRSVFFVNREFFVLVDEALGNSPGLLDLHFQLAPGPAVIDTPRKLARTAFADGGNVLVWMPLDAPVRLREEPGQVSFVMNLKEPRPAFAFRHQRAAPAAFLTVIAPYRGAQTPTVNARFAAPFAPGEPRVELEVTVAGKRWYLMRDLAAGEGVCAATYFPSGADSTPHTSGHPNSR